MKNTPKILTCKRVKSKNNQTRQPRVLTDSYRRSDAANNIEPRHISLLVPALRPQTFKWNLHRLLQEKIIHPIENLASNCAVE